MAEQSKEKRGKGTKTSGRKYDQKMKPFLVYQYLMQCTDNEHFETGDTIADHLKKDFGIPAERRSIYHDIDEINKALLAHQEGISLEEAEKRIAEDESEKIIQYQKKKGFYVAQRPYEEDDIRLLTECIYTSKFVTEKKSKELVNILGEFVSEHQAEKIQHNAFVADRVKTANNKVWNNIATINTAMSYSWDGEPHTPEQISFKYLKYEIADVPKQVERRHGARYTVSPYHFIINDGNYYLLVYEKEKFRIYRVDRMSDVRLTGEPREGKAEFEKINLKSYAIQHFSMFDGEERHVTIQAIHTLLDTMVERFGNDKQNAIFSKVDDTHFRMTIKVNISDQFFGWLLGFGRRVKLIEPDDVVEQFAAYIKKVGDMYQ